MNTSTLQHAESVEGFPYWAKAVSWILIAEDGTITNPRGMGERDVALLAAKGGATLLIAWPGQWSTTTFVVASPEMVPSRKRD